MRFLYRCYLLLMFFLFSAVIIEAQQTQFQKVYTLFEYGASANLISEDSDGYLITGYEFNSSHTPAGYFFLRTDLKGKTLWCKTLPRNKVYAGTGINGKEISFFPGSAADLEAAECVYETLPGWDEDLSGVTTYDALPENTKNYVAAIEKIVGVPVSIVGVGPKRRQAIFR